MTLAEISLILETCNFNLEIKRKDMFVLAKLMAFSFNDPKKMPKYEDIYQNSNSVTINSTNPTSDELRKIWRENKQDWRRSKARMEEFITSKKHVNKGVK